MTKNLARWGLVFFVASSFPFLNGFAESPQRIPEELALTETVVTQDRDELELTPKMQFFKGAEGKQVDLVTDGQYGLTDRLEWDVEVPYEFLNPSGGQSVSGIGDVETGLRYGVVDYRTQPLSLTAGLRIGIPTGNRGNDLGDGRLSLEPSFTASQWLGHLNVELNLSWRHAVTNAGTEPKDEYQYNLAILCPMHQWFFVLEGDGETTSQRTKYFITPEVVWKLLPQLELFVAVPLGVTHAAGDYGVAVGMTLELENILHRGADKD